jgi:uncharacterized membrane protein SpoIIM required for sporulation
MSFIFIGIPAQLNLLFNGFVFGSYLRGAILVDNLSKIKIIMLVLPHSIFEFFGVLISTVIPVELCLEIGKRIFYKVSDDEYWESFIVIIKLLGLSVLLILIAAWIETHVTLKLI